MTSPFLTDLLLFVLSTIQMMVKVSNMKSPQVKISILLSIIFLMLSTGACSKLESTQKGQQEQSLHLKDLPHSNDNHFAQSGVTALLQFDQQLLMGHQNGSISLWDNPITKNSQLRRAWFAHEQSIRQLTEVQTGYTSLSADGSWVTWSRNHQLSKRYRAPFGHPNVILHIDETTDILGGDRGAISKYEHGQRLWRTAGEHGRAVFGIASMKPNKILSVGSDGWMRCWTIDRGDRCGALPIHDGWVTMLRPFSGGYLTSGSDGMIKFWSSKSLAALTHSESQSSYAVLATPEAQMNTNLKNISTISLIHNLVIIGNDKGTIKLLEYDKDMNHFFTKWQTSLAELAPITSIEMNFKQNTIYIGGGRVPKLAVIKSNSGELDFMKSWQLNQFVITIIPKNT